MWSTGGGGGYALLLKKLDNLNTPGIAAAEGNWDNKWWHWRVAFGRLRWGGSITRSR